MSKLTNKVQQCGMCNYCGDKSVTSISYMEAKAAIEVVKAECIAAIEEKSKKCRVYGNIFNVGDAIEAIRNIE